MCFGHKVRLARPRLQTASRRIAPLISKDSYAAGATRRLSDRLFGGRAAPLVMHLAKDDGLSEDDIAELEALLAKLKQGE